jgi:molybdate transport system permease protein
MDLLTPAELEALRLSLRVAAWSVACSLPLGIAVAWLLARSRMPGRLLLDGIVHLPLVVPPVVIGYLLLLGFGRRGPIGGWLHETFGVSIAFTWKGAALASAVMAFPLLVRAVRLSLEGVDRRLEAAARTLGAGPVKVFATVTLPLMMPGILAGAILAFARSLGEFGATITFVSNIPGETRTLPLALYTATQTPDGDLPAMRLAAISVAIAVVALVGSELLARRVQRRVRA